MSKWKSRLVEIGQRVFRRLTPDVATKGDVESVYRRLAAAMSVRDIVGPGAPLGVLGGWAMDPEALLFILRDLTSRKDPTIVEFGSGESTIAFSAALRSMGCGKLVSIEHDEEFHRSMVERIRAAGLSDWVDLRLTPIGERNETEVGPLVSYRLSHLDTPLDIAVVDGPPAQLFGEHTRVVPLEWAIEHMRPGASVYADDLNRPGERQAVAALRAAHPDLEETRLPCKEVVICLRRRSSQR